MNKLHISIFVLVIGIVTGAYSMDPTQAPEYTLHEVAHALSQLCQKLHLNLSETRKKAVLRSKLLQLSESMRRQYLYHAARYENASLFDAWLSVCAFRGAYQWDENNNSLMHLICGSPESGEKVRQLISMGIGADIHVLNKQGQTPLQRAQQAGDTAVEKALERLIEARNQDAARIAAGGTTFSHNTSDMLQSKGGQGSGGALGRPGVDGGTLAGDLRDW